LHPPTVVPLAHEFSAAPRNHTAAEAPSLRTAMLGRMGSFALCVGTVEIRKNRAALLKLWASLAREAGEGWPKLVVAGEAGWRAGEALRDLRRADREAPYLWIEAPTGPRADLALRPVRFHSLSEPRPGLGAADR